MINIYIYIISISVIFTIWSSVSIWWIRQDILSLEKIILCPFNMADSTQCTIMLSEHPSSTFSHSITNLYLTNFNVLYHSRLRSNMTLSDQINGSVWKAICASNKIQSRLAIVPTECHVVPVNDLDKISLSIGHELLVYRRISINQSILCWTSLKPKLLQLLLLQLTPS